MAGLTFYTDSNGNSVTDSQDVCNCWITNEYKYNINYQLQTGLAGFPPNNVKRCLNESSVCHPKILFANKIFKTAGKFYYSVKRDGIPYPNCRMYAY